MTRPRWGRLRPLLPVVLLLAAACGDSSASGDDRGSDDSSGRASAPLASAGDAPAAAGSGLDTPPGPADRAPFPDFGEVALAVTDADGEERCACVLLAETADQRTRGLMEVTDLGGYAGMVFVADEESEQSFWMRDTPMPLSIAWFDDDGDLVSTADMEPCVDGDACPSYPSEGPARFSLEVPQGELDQLGIGEGSTLRLGGDCQ